MRAGKSLFLAVTLLVSAPGVADTTEATGYTTVQGWFDAGTAITYADIGRSWFTGRFYTRQEPNSPWNALLIAETRPDNGPGFPGDNKAMISSVEGPADFYDYMTEENRRGTLRWIDQEWPNAWVVEETATGLLGGLGDYPPFEIRRHEGYIVVRFPAGNGRFLYGYFFRKVYPVQ